MTKRLHCALDGQFVKRRGGTWCDGSYMHKKCARAYMKEMRNGEKNISRIPTLMMNFLPAFFAMSIFTTVLSNMAFSSDASEKQAPPTRKQWRATVPT